MSPNDELTPHESASPARSRSRLVRWLGYATRVVLVVAVLSAGGAVSAYWLMNRPTAKRRPAPSQATLVAVSQTRAQAHRVVVRAMGTVVPARHIQLASRVSGEIVRVSPALVPGGRFKAGEKILLVDPRDYQFAVQQHASALAKTQSDMRLEMGQQSVAKREYELLGKEVTAEDKDLVLRQPQLATARAAVSAAQASLDKARLDLERTKVVAPFNATVQSRDVNLGSQISVGTPLASLVGTDEYWVQVSLPVDQLKWIDIPGTNSEQGSTVRVHHETAWAAGAFRTGTVERLMTELEPQGRMARLLVAVRDPLALKSAPTQRHPLILGSYVRVELVGREVPDVVRVPRTALRDGERVWAMAPDRTLDIREVTIVWSSNSHVYVAKGLAQGDLLVTSDLAAPVQGMALRTAGPTTRRTPPRPVGGPATQRGSEGRP